MLNDEILAVNILARALLARTIKYHMSGIKIREKLHGSNYFRRYDIKFV